MNKRIDFSTMPKVFGMCNIADFTKLKYSYNVGIWGTSICGGEVLDSKQGLPESA